MIHLREYWNTKSHPHISINCLKKIGFLRASILKGYKRIQTQLMKSSIMLNLLHLAYLFSILRVLKTGGWIHQVGTYIRTWWKAQKIFYMAVDNTKVSINNMYHDYTVTYLLVFHVCMFVPSAQLDKFLVVVRCILHPQPIYMSPGFDAKSTTHEFRFSPAMITL